MKQPIPKALKVYMGMSKGKVGHHDFVEQDHLIEATIKKSPRDEQEERYGLMMYVKGMSYMCRQMDKKCKKCKWASH